MQSNTARILPFQLPEGTRIDEKSGALEIDTDDGGVVIDFNPQLDGDEDRESDHDENLADVLEESELSLISSRVLEGIEADEQSRSKWISDREKGINLLGLTLEQSRSDTGSSAGPVEGMSTVRHPLLLEACLRFQANARGELLPAAGPVKVKNVGSETVATDDQAKRLERDMNAYLTSVAREYYPDTDRLLFGVGFEGSGFKKIYHCPLRRRPVSESIPGKDLIVSNTATDLYNAGRVTHQIAMGQDVLKRMQITGAYRDIDLTPPNEEPSSLTQKEGNIQGIRKTGSLPKDIDHTIFECYCNLDIPGYEHKKEGKITGLPLPYKVVIDKTSRKVLEIRRNWKEGDEECKKRRVFVLYPFVPMFGFYPTGLLHILGNTTNAITVAWRVLLDSGMFANFPGFLYAKNGSRQTNLSMRVAPGSGSAVDVGATGDITKAIMPIPYKEPGVATMQLVENIASTGQRVGGVPDTPVGDGNAEVPVGTTLANIEDAHKIISAVHKRIHAAQAEEFEILKEHFAEDPESLWRHNGDTTPPWDVQELLDALQNYNLVPCADPNTPSQAHRLMRVTAIKQMQGTNPAIYDPRAVDEYCLREIGVADPERFFVPPAPPPPAAPDPNLLNAQAKMQANEVKQQDIQTRAETEAAKMESQEHIEQMRIAERLAVHPEAQGILQAENQGSPS